MNPFPHSGMFSRREMLRNTGAGFGTLALTGLFSDLARAETAPLVGPLSPKPAHHFARAKRVIFLFMHGGPSQVDTFDYKPKLHKEDGKALPFAAASNISANMKLMKSPWKFAQHGASGQWISELFPHLSKHADKLCMVKSVHSRGQSHGQAVSMLHTGSDNLPRPSVGAWVSYGLGTESQNLPSYMSIGAPTAHGGPRNYSSGFLPAIHQATAIGAAGQLGKGSIANLDASSTSADQRRQLDLLQEMNREHLTAAGKDAQIEGAIESFELAFRMQQTAPGVLDLATESKATQELYGIGNKDTENFGRMCLMARKCAEAGVRYIQVSTGNVWDQHGNLKAGHEKNALNTDRPIAGLLTDLASRGLLEDTLVVWGGEFGRTPIAQGTNGRDHNPQGFTMWMAGGGVKSGFSYGETDDFGYYAVKDKVHMHDLHATILHLLGVDHERLTYRYAGRDFRLTDVYGRVVNPLLA